MISVMKHLFKLSLLFPAVAAQPVDSRRPEIVFRPVNVVPIDQVRVSTNPTLIA